MYMDLVIPVAWGVVVAASGSFLTDSRSPWYREVLKKPSWQPPDWAFGPAWTIIFGLAGWAFYLGLRDAPDQGSRLLLIALFVANGLANILWNPLFFRAAASGLGAVRGALAMALGPGTDGAALADIRHGESPAAALPVLGCFRRVP